MENKRMEKIIRWKIFFGERKYLVIIILEAKTSFHLSKSKFYIFYQTMKLYIRKEQFHCLYWLAFGGYVNNVCDRAWPFSWSYFKRGIIFRENVTYNFLQGIIFKETITQYFLRGIIFIGIITQYFLREIFFIENTT